MDINLNSEKMAKPILQIKNNKVIQRWDSAKQAEKDGNYNASSIRDVCVGRRKTHKGYKWEYEDMSDIFTQKNGNTGIRKPIQCTYINGDVYEYESKKEASLALGLKESTIKNILLNKTKQHKDFILNYL